MIAAIYARKSTEQTGVNEEAKSVARQVERAKAFAASKGWAVDEAHVYVDDGVSGAEFKNRPGFARLMAAVDRPKPAFAMLVMSEPSRLGREAVATASAMKAITESGVEVWTYLDGKRHEMDSAIDKMMFGLQSFGSELEREHASTRTHDALLKKFMAGHHVGGRTFGYTNRDIAGGVDSHGRAKRSHVVLEINEAQASVVRRIFTDYAGGLGLKRLACDLNKDRVPAPRGTGSWAPSAIREILRRTTYRGQLTWNRSKSTMKRGTSGQEARPTEEHVSIEAPHLRIIDEPLWLAVQVRLAQAGGAFVRRSGGGRGKAGTIIARAGRLDGESPYLLAGFLVCAQCGGPLGGLTAYHGSGPTEKRHRVTHYGCSKRRQRGPTVCENGSTIRTDALDMALLATIRQLVAPDMLAEAVDRALATLTAGVDDRKATRLALERDLKAADARVTRLVEAITSGGALDALVESLKTEEAKGKALRAQLDVTPAAPPQLDADRIKAELLGLANDIVGLLSDHRTPATRAMLRKLLDGAIMASPVTLDGRKGYRLNGSVNVGALLTGDVYAALRAPKTEPPRGLIPLGPHTSLDFGEFVLVGEAVA